MNFFSTAPILGLLVCAMLYASFVDHNGRQAYGRVTGSDRHGGTAVCRLKIVWPRERITIVNMNYLRFMTALPRWLEFVAESKLKNLGMSKQ